MFTTLPQVADKAVFRTSDLTLIGRARGTRDEAITYCTVEIDGLLAREDAALKPHRDDDRR